MNKIFSNILLVATSVAMIASCAKEIETNPQKEHVIENEAQFNYIFAIGSSDKDTKSEFSAANKYVSWEEGDDFLGVYAKKGENISYNQKCDVATSPSLSFTLKSHYALETGDALYAYYPYDYVNTSTTAYRNPNNVHLTIASSQNQDGTSFDSSAMPMVAKYVLEADLAADTGTAVATMNFANLAGILDFKVYSSNATFRAESVQSVTFEANSAICGEFNYNLSALDYETASTLVISGYEGTAVTTTVTNPVALTDSKATAYDVCMAVAPGSYTGKVTVVTDKAIYTYNVSSTKTVGRSQILSLGVNLGTGTRVSINPVDYAWSLVKDVKEIAPGEWVLIAALGSDVALSTVQNNNNRGEVAITKSEDALTAASTAQIFEIENGSVASSYAFKAVNGATRNQYIYAQSSSSNNMKSQATIDGNASWALTINSSTGNADIVAQGTNTHNVLRYNSSSSIFSAYESGKQAEVGIYILNEPTAVKLRASTTTVNFFATEGSGDNVDVDFFLKNVSTWTVTNTNTTAFDVDDSIIDTKSGIVSIAPKAVNNTYSDKVATVTVSATGADDVVISVSQTAKVASLTATPDKTVATKDEDMIEIEIETNVPWAISSSHGTVDFVDGSADPYNSDDYSAPATTTTTVYAIIPENTTGANRDITITITPNEVGCGLSNKVITVNQLGTAGVKLSDPEDVTITNISIASKNFAGSWSAVDNATNYDWMISTSSTAPANTSDASVKAYGNVTTTSFSATASAAPAAGTVYYLYVKANGSGTYTPSDYVQAHAILYQHVFTTKPSSTPVTLSTISWGVTSSNLYNYSNDYKGVQVGTGSKTGYLTLTSSNAWGAQTSTNYYNGYTTVKKVVVWMNAGNDGTITASVTIGGIAATSDGTEVRKVASPYPTDYSGTTPVAFTPASTGKTGAVVITANKGTDSAKAGYVSAIEVLSE